MRSKDENFRLIDPSTYLVQKECISDETFDYFKGFVIHELGSIKSAKDYYYTLIDYIGYIGKDILDAKEKDAKAYLKFLNEQVEKNLIRYKSIYKKQSQIAAFSLYLSNHVPGFKNYFEFMERVMPSAQVLPSKIATPEEISIILENADETLGLIITLIIRVGLTASEVRELKVSHFLADRDNKVYILFNERYKKRYLYVPDDVFDKINTYICKNNFGKTDYIFPSKKDAKKPINERTLSRKVVSLMNDCGFKYTLQDLRNTSIVLSLKGGANPDDVAETLGFHVSWIQRYSAAVEAYHTSPAIYQHITVR